MGDDHGEEIDRKIDGKEDHWDKKSANKDTDEAHFQKVQCLHLRWYDESGAGALTHLGDGFKSAAPSPIAVSLEESVDKYSHP